MINKLPIRKIITVLLLLVVLFIAYKLFWFGSVTATNTESYSTVAVESVGKLDNGSKKLRPGKYKLQARGPLVKPQDVEFTIMPFSNERIDLSVESWSINDLVEHVVVPRLSPEFKVGKTQLLEDNTWLVAFIYSPDGQLEGYTNVFNFDGSEWKIFESGTGFELEGYTDTGLPQSVINYLRGE